MVPRPLPGDVKDWLAAVLRRALLFESFGEVKAGLALTERVALPEPGRRLALEFLTPPALRFLQKR